MSLDSVMLTSTFSFQTLLMESAHSVLIQISARKLQRQMDLSDCVCRTCVESLDSSLWATHWVGPLVMSPSRFQQDLQCIWLCWRKVHKRLESSACDKCSDNSIFFFHVRAVCFVWDKLSHVSWLLNELMFTVGLVWPYFTCRVIDETGLNHSSVGTCFYAGLCLGDNPPVLWSKQGWGRPYSLTHCQMIISTYNKAGFELHCGSVKMKYTHKCQHAD